jgi:hypothetical protein
VWRSCLPPGVVAGQPHDLHRSFWKRCDDCAGESAQYRVRRSRRMASVAALNHAEQVWTTNNPGLLYVAIAQPNWSLQLNLYSVPASGGALQTIVTNLGTPWFVASRDGGRVAYQGSRYDSDTIYVASTSAQTDRVGFPSTGQRPRVISISPNGSQLIYASTAGLYLTRTDGSGLSQAISLSSAGSPAAMAPQVLWSGDVPHLLVAEQTSDSVSLLDLDAVSGSRSRCRASQGLGSAGGLAACSE